VGLRILSSVDKNYQVGESKWGESMGKGRRKVLSRKREKRNGISKPGTCRKPYTGGNWGGG